MNNRLLVYLLVLCFFNTGAQSTAGTGPREISSKKLRQIKQHQRREHRAKRKREKEEKKVIKKHHKRIQTKEVRKRMKSSRKTALRNNSNKREFFLKRWHKKRAKPATKTKKKSDTI